MILFWCDRSCSGRVDVGAVVADVDKAYAGRYPKQIDRFAVDFCRFFFKRRTAHVETVFAGIGCRFDYYDGHRVAVGVELLAGKCGVVVFVKCDWGNFDFCCWADNVPNARTVAISNAIIRIVLLRPIR